MSADSILTTALAVGEIVVLAQIARRRIWRTLPVFSLYMLWQFISDMTGLYFQVALSEKYFFFFITQSVVDAVLFFAVLMELSWSVLRPIRASLPKKTIFFLGILIAVGALIVWPFAGMNIESLTPQAQTFMHLNQTMVLLRILCFVIMAAFSQLLSIGWRDRELQIATGLGIYSIVTMVVSILDSHQSDVNKIHSYHQLVTISYLGSLIYWVLSFAAKEYQRREFSPQMQQFLVYMSGAARSGSIALTDITPDHSRKRD